MADLQEVTGVNFEIAFEKFQQDLEDITRNQKGEVCIVLYSLAFRKQILRSQVCCNLKSWKNLESLKLLPPGGSLIRMFVRRSKRSKTVKF